MQSTTVIAICWRVFISLSTRTFFQPDEYFQSLEVAHHAVFGYGHLTWEWCTSSPIRSIIYPSIFVPVYWALKLTKLDETSLVVLIAAPKLTQGVLAAVTDIWVQELAKKSLGERYASTAFFLSLTSFFHILSLGRTLSNSLETSLTTIALCYWPLGEKIISKQVGVALSFAAAACMVRPTNGILWVFLSVDLLWRLRKEYRVIRSFILAVLVVGLISSSILFTADSLYFGKTTLTPINFLRTNLTSVSLFYGQNPWHYYVSQALPILCTTSLPFFAYGAWSNFKTGLPGARRLLFLIVWTVSVYSLAGHKEWRFIHPLLPAIHVISAKALVDLYFKHRARIGNPATGKVWPQSSEPRPKLPIRNSHLLLISLGLFSAVYVTFFHSRAQIGVMLYLRSLNPHTDLKSVGFLMPCHSTPSHAYLHRPELAEAGRMWQIGCEPPLAGQALSNYEDQTGFFYKSPVSYLKTKFPSVVDPSFPPSSLPTTRPGSLPPPNNQWEHQWPSHFVLFGALVEDREFAAQLKKLGYKEVWSGANGWEEDERRRGGVRVWAWRADMSDTL